jgi:hypothetical protein
LHSYEYVEGILSDFIGETVNKDEQINLLDADETLSTTQSMMSLSTATSTTMSSTSSAISSTLPMSSALAGGLDGRTVNADEWEKERTALYRQLDEKV